jgi:hypothetical protein
MTRKAEEAVADDLGVHNDENIVERMTRSRAEQWQLRSFVVR